MKSSSRSACGPLLPCASTRASAYCSISISLACTLDPGKYDPLPVFPRQKHVAAHLPNPVPVSHFRMISLPLLQVPICLSTHQSLTSPLVIVPHPLSPPLLPVLVLHLSQRPFVTPLVRKSPLRDGPLAWSCSSCFDFCTAAGADKLPRCLSFQAYRRIHTSLPSFPSPQPCMGLVLRDIADLIFTTSSHVCTIFIVLFSFCHLLLTEFTLKAQNLKVIHPHLTTCPGEWNGIKPSSHHLIASYSSCKPSQADVFALWLTDPRNP